MVDLGPRTGTYLSIAFKCLVFFAIIQSGIRSLSMLCIQSVSCVLVAA